MKYFVEKYAQSSYIIIFLSEVCRYGMCFVLLCIIILSLPAIQSFGNSA